MDSTQRVAIATPATGLLVYQTDGTDGFWFYSGTAWVSLNGSTANIPDAITDTDGDTKVQVEESADEDIIRFDAAGSEAMLIDSNGNVGICTGAPQAKLHVAGGLRVDRSPYIGGGPLAPLNIEGGTTGGGDGIFADSNHVYRTTGLYEGGPKSDSYLITRIFKGDDSLRIEMSAEFGSAWARIKPAGSGVWDTIGTVTNTGSSTQSFDYVITVAGNYELEYSYSINNPCLPPPQGCLYAWAHFYVYASDGQPVGLQPSVMIDSTGNVGIGTSALDAKLHVVGDVKIVDGNQGDGKVLTSDANGVAGWSTPQNDGDWTVNDPNMYASVSGNVGIGTSSPEAKLHVVGDVKIVDGTQAAGKVLTSDANGLASWHSPSPGTFEIADTDSDTKIQVEEAGVDDDIIRFDMDGTEFFRMDSGRLEVLNTGHSVFIGEGAGANDDFTYNKNVAVGDSALFSNTTGLSNTASGYQSLYSNTIGSANTASGRSSLYSNTEGDYNTAYGYQSLYSNTMGYYNTASGHNSLYSNTEGDYNTASGRYSLSNNTTGRKNTALGYGADVSTGNLTNATAIGANAIVSQDSSLVLGNAAKVGIGTSTPDNSAQLEVSSTTKGFLPPRMTEDERNAISSPAAGLVAWCTNCGPSGELQVYNGSAWTNMIGGLVSVYTPSIGDYHQGGVIFYLDGNGGGLVCAVSDQSAGAEWGCSGSTISGADGNAIGTGSQNTIDIEAGCTTPGIAADICANLSLNGYSDWFLPSRDELIAMYQNKATINATAIANGGGGFAADYYWSSTEYNTTGADGFDFGNGYVGVNYKYSTNSVRAVRAF